METTLGFLGDIVDFIICYPTTGKTAKFSETMHRRIGIGFFVQEVLRNPFPTKP